MPFNSESGRKAGQKSKRGEAKTTKEVKELVRDLVVDLNNEVINDLSKLEPKEKADILARLIEFVIPKQRQTETTINQDNPSVIIDMGTCIDKDDELNELKDLTNESK